MPFALPCCLLLNEKEFIYRKKLDLFWSVGPCGAVQKEITEQTVIKNKISWNPNQGIWMTAWISFAVGGWGVGRRRSACKAGDNGCLFWLRWISILPGTSRSSCTGREIGRNRIWDRKEADAWISACLGPSSGMQQQQDRGVEGGTPCASLQLSLHPLSVTTSAVLCQGPAKLWFHISQTGRSYKHHLLLTLSPDSPRIPVGPGRPGSPLAPLGPC